MKLFKNQKEVQKQINKYGEKLIIYDKLIIDVQNFKHPGPQNLVDENIGKDIKKLFDNQNHSKNAINLIKKYQVGLIVGEQNQQIKNLMLNDKEEELIKKLDQKIDINKPLQKQIDNLTIDEFFFYISRPRFVKSDDSIQLFDNKFVDFMNKSNIWINLLIIIIISGNLLLKSIKQIQNTYELILFLAIFIFSILVFWTFIEYYQHRFVLHNEDQLYQNSKQGEIFKVFSTHIHHHVYMNQKYRIAQGLILNAPYYLILWFVFNLLFGSWIAQIKLAGFLIGQQLYDQLHYYFHFGSEPYFNFIKQLKTNHMKHHWRNRKLGFGVTNTFWDKVLKTAHQ